ncbi:MAG: hypothetical protein GEU90_12055 [Gemmatimonas sp.]|nr:hypothetical protein [Gemmatimonas sp.]
MSLADGNQLVCAALEAVGIDCVFGVPGTQNVGLFEALRRSRLRTVLATHELGAAFMANGYYRASGRPAALVTIPGPGFTYALPGLAEARLDSAALLYLVAQPATRPGRRFQLQAIDQAAIAAPLVKSIRNVDSVGELEAAIVAGYAESMAGEPGPVMIHIESSALDSPAGPSTGSVAFRGAQPDAASVHLQGELGEVAAAFASARRPVLFLGQGALPVASAFRELVERRPLPVITTPSARGLLADDHPCLVGFDVMRDELDQLNALLDTSDLVLVLGSKLGHNGTAGFGIRFPEDRLIHVDTSQEVLGANYRTSLAVSASSAAVAQVLSRELDRSNSWQTWPAEELAAWKRQLRRAEQGVEPSIAGTSGGSAREFFDRLRRILPPDAILVTDSGLHQSVARRYFRVQAERGLIIPSDFQSMGFGIPAAIGARFAAPDRPIAALVGDGGFQMSAMELLTATREEIPLLVVVFNDGRLNLIRLQQIGSYGRQHAVDLRNPDFQGFASAVGADYVLFDRHSDELVRAALAGRRPTLVEVRVGDSPSIWRMQASARAKQTVRGALGEGMVGRLKRLVRPRSG